MDKINGECLHKNMIFIAMAEFKDDRKEYYYHCEDCGEQLTFDKEQQPSGTVIMQKQIKGDEYKNI